MALKAMTSEVKVMTTTRLMRRLDRKENETKRRKPVCMIHLNTYLKCLKITSVLLKH